MGGYDANAYTPRQKDDEEYEDGNIPYYRKPSKLTEAIDA